MRLLEEVNTTKGNAGGCGEAGQVLSLAVLFCLAKISVYAYKKNCKGKVYCKGMGIRVRSETCWRYYLTLIVWQEISL